MARTAEERDLLWKGRKNAFGAVGRVSPTYYVQDGVVPRTQIAPTLRFIGEVGRKYGLTISNIFHAGDGNMHPIILFDPRKPGDLEKARAAGEEILLHCIEVGGTITGEHGVGMEKNELMDKLFSPETLDLIRSLKLLFDPDTCSIPARCCPPAGAAWRSGSRRSRPIARSTDMLTRRDLLYLSAAAAFPAARMTSKERVDRALRGEDVDRPPFTFWHHFLDEKLPGERHAKATLDFHRKFRTDLVKVMSDYPYPKPAGRWYELKVAGQPLPRAVARAGTDPRRPRRARRTSSRPSSTRGTWRRSSRRRKRCGA